MLNSTVFAGVGAGAAQDEGESFVRTVPSASRKRPKATERSAISARGLEKTFDPISKASSPEILMTAMPPAPERWRWHKCAPSTASRRGSSCRIWPKFAAHSQFQ